MPTIWFIRHGQKASVDSGDPGISAHGRVEARATARLLATQPISRVYSSPLLRAVETAEVVASAWGLHVESAALLRERVNWGDQPGQSVSEFQEMWARCTSDRDLVPPVGDSSRAAGRRLEAFLSQFSEGPADLHVVAVTHGGVLADFLRNVFSDSELSAANSAFAGDPYDGEVMRECSVTCISSNLGSIEIASLAASDHLQSPPRSAG